MTEEIVLETHVGGQGSAESGDENRHDALSLLAVPQDGHATEEIQRSERKKKTKSRGEVSLSAISLSPVLPSLDSTD